MPEEEIAPHKHGNLKEKILFVLSRFDATKKSGTSVRVKEKMSEKGNKRANNKLNCTK